MDSRCDKEGSKKRYYLNKPNFLEVFSNVTKPSKDSGQENIQ